MTILSDENLMAYVDKELDEASAREVEQALASSPEAREKVRVFEESAQALRAYDTVLTQPLPERLVTALAASDADQTRNASNTTEASKQRAASTGDTTNVTSLRARQLFSPRLALAASVLLMLGFFVGTALNSPPSDTARSSATAMAQLLPEALDTHLSGEPLSLTDAGSSVQHVVMPLTTFATEDQRVCRSFEYMQVPGNTQVGVACRLPTGRWDLQMLVPDNLVMQAPASDEPTNYQPASGGGAFVDAFKSQNNARDEISVNDEQDLIDRGWER